MWNNKLLKPPPTSSYIGDPNSVGKYIDTHFSVNITSKNVFLKFIFSDVEILRRCLENFKNEIQKCQSNLNIEGALLSRIIYRLNLKFHKDQGMKYLRKINTSMKRYLNFDLVSNIKHFMLSIPTITNTEKVYYPTKQMLEFLMVRIQSFSKLMLRIFDNGVEVIRIMICRMKLGQLWNYALLLLAISSRIVNICQYLIDASCACFDTLVAIHEQLQLYGVQWLEPGYTLPYNLRNWLNLSWTPEDLRKLEQKR